MIYNLQGFIPEETAYALICQFNTDEGGRNAVSARGWLQYSSWIRSEYMSLTNGSTLYRDGMGYIRQYIPNL